MKKTSIGKRISALFGAAVIAGTALSAMPVTQAEAAGTNILILGDSISAGYGLKSNQQGYYDYIADVTGGTVTNLAKTGDGTNELIEKLGTQEFKNAVKSANIICISVGGNDLLGPARDYLQSFQQEGEALLDTVIRVAKEGDPISLMTGMTRALRPARNSAETNYTQIESMIREQNTNAKVIFQTIYNPVDLPNSFFTERGYSSETISKYQTLYTYVDNIIDDDFNNVIRSLGQSDCADIYNDFIETGWLYDRILEKDVHPTTAGHALIAASVLNTAGITSGSSGRMKHTLDSMKLAEYNQIPANDLTLMKKYFGAYDTVLGDVNDDGAVQSTDAQALLQIYLATVLGEPLETQISAYQMAVGDIDKDQKISAKDAQYILVYFLSNSVLGDNLTWEEIMAP